MAFDEGEPFSFAFNADFAVGFDLDFGELGRFEVSALGVPETWPLADLVLDFVDDGLFDFFPAWPVEDLYFGFD